MQRDRRVERREGCGVTVFLDGVQVIAPYPYAPGYGTGHAEDVVDAAKAAGSAEEKLGRDALAAMAVVFFGSLLVASTTSLAWRALAWFWGFLASLISFPIAGRSSLGTEPICFIKPVNSPLGPT